MSAVGYAVFISCLVCASEDAFAQIVHSINVSARCGQFLSAFTCSSDFMHRSVYFRISITMSVAHLSRASRI